MEFRGPHGYGHRGRKLANHLSARYGESATDRQPQRDYLKDHPPAKSIPSARVTFRNLEMTRGLPERRERKAHACAIAWLQQLPTRAIACSVEPSLSLANASYTSSSSLCRYLSAA